MRETKGNSLMNDFALHLAYYMDYNNYHNILPWTIMVAGLHTIIITNFQQYFFVLSL